MTQGEPYLGRRAAALLVAAEAAFLIFAWGGIATDTDPDTGESLIPVAAALAIVMVPLVVVFVATAWMLWRGRIWPASAGRNRAVRNFLALGIVVLINVALTVQGLVGAMTLQLETSRAIAGLIGVVVVTACVTLVRQSWLERWPEQAR